METIAQYSLEQGLTPRLIKIDELYAPNALGPALSPCGEGGVPRSGAPGEGRLRRARHGGST